MMFDILDKRRTPLPFPHLKLCILFMFICTTTGLQEFDENMIEISQTRLYKSIFTTTTEEPVASQCPNIHNNNKNVFGWADYTVLAAMLLISCAIGIFYGFFSTNQNTSDDFLLGGSCMGTFPMALSLAASFITAIELLGNPAEMYKYGSQFWMICAAFILVVPITSKFYLPVFMKLRLTSSYEYLERRFNSYVKLLASGLYILQMTLYTSVAVYTPALALSHVTGLNVYAAVTVVYVVCIFYASQGGMKAVIMTDTFQAAVLLGSILLILHLGEKDVGGVGVIWSENYKTNRLEIFNMNPNLTIRHSLWSVVIGGMFYWMSMFCSNQASIQKYLSVETIAQARRALWTSAVGLILVFTINFYMGMVLVAHYHECDPLKTKEISSADEILPLYVISNLGYLQGLTGFFVAGIFAASLGTVASALNSLSAVTCSDFITGALGITFPETKGALWAKWISFMYGVISFALVFVIEQLGSVMQVAITLNGMVGGVTLGLFSLGMFFPFANSRGALFGALTAAVLVMWMALGQQVAMANGEYHVPEKPTSIEKCPCSNYTFVEEKIFPMEERADVFFLYRISYLWYSTIGFFITIIVGLIVSFQTGPQNPSDVNDDLISPPATRTYDSLPVRVKEFLKIPLKRKHQPGNNIPLKCNTNVGVNVNDSNIKK